MKRCTPILLGLLLLLMLSTAVAGKEPKKLEFGPFTYVVNSDKTATITDYTYWKNSENEGNIVIPNMIERYSVIAIGDNAFASDSTRYYREISVTIPDSVISIGDKAFWYAGAHTINIPTSVKQIGTGAFVTDKVSTKFIVAPDHDTFAVVNGHLYNKVEKKLLCANGHGDWQSIDCIIPEGIKAIDDYALSGAMFRSLTIPPSVTSIGKYAFASSDVYSDAPISISLENVTSLGEGAFSDCQWLNAREEFPLSTAITQIPDYAFARSNPNVCLHEGIDSIGKYAFQGCTFSSIHLPGTVREIAEGAFMDIVIKDTLTEDRTLVLGEGLTSIGEKAFAKSSIDVVSLPSNLMSIGNYAFEESRVRELSIAEGLKTISEGAFRGCWYLRNVSIPQSVTNIEAEAFANCRNMNEVTLSENVNNIGANAFDRTHVTLILPKESYAERWAQENTYDYRYVDGESTLDWLND